MKNTISELKNTVEGMKSRLDEAGSDQQAGGQSRKKNTERARKGKMTQKEQRGVKETTEQHET